MKTKLFFLSVVIPVCPDDGDGGCDGYTLVWSDEFNGSSLNANAWNIETVAEAGAMANCRITLRIIFLLVMAVWS